MVKGSHLMRNWILLLSFHLEADRSEWVVEFSCFGRLAWLAGWIVPFHSHVELNLILILSFYHIILKLLLSIWFDYFHILLFYPTDLIGWSKLSLLLSYHQFDLIIFIFLCFSRQTWLAGWSWMCCWESLTQLSTSSKHQHRWNRSKDTFGK